MKKKWMALLSLVVLLLLGAVGACAEEMAAATIELAFDGKTYTDTVQVSWMEGYPVPEGGVKWDGTEGFIGEVHRDDWNVIDGKDFSYVEGQIMFLANLGVSFYDVEQIAAKHNARIVAYIAVTNCYVIELVSDQSLDNIYRVISELKKENKLVFESVIPHYAHYVSLCGVPNDPWKYADWDEEHPNDENWGMEAIRAVSMWDYTEFSSAMNIGIIDDMFDDSHEDLEFARIYDVDTDTSSSHGTNVAGILLASHNTVGVSGVFPKGSAVAIGTKGANNAEYDTWEELFYDVVRQFAIMIVNDVHIINRSMAQDPIDENQYDALVSWMAQFNPYFDIYENIEYNGQKGYDFVFVNAAGNSQTEAYLQDWTQWISSDYFRNRLIVVGSVGNTENGVVFSESFGWGGGSNFGRAVDIVAPGEYIYSCYKGGYSDTYSGTSQAAPHVSGVAAMVWSLAPNLTGPEVKDIILKNSTEIIRDQRGYPYPMLNAYASAKDGFMQAKGNGQLTLQVFDKDTLKGVYDYNISIEPLEVCQEKEKTSVNGVKVSPYVKQLKLGKYRVVVSKEGYKPHTEIITVTRDSEINMNVTMIPTEAPEITKGRIEGTAVSNMTSTIHVEIDAIRNGQTITTLVSDYEGKFGAELETGTYSLVVKKDGITFANKEVVVFTGKVTDVQLELVNPTLKELPASDFTYEIVGGKYVKITGYIGATKTDFVFPSYIDGLPVREIGDYALYNRTDLRGRLVLPNTLLKIGNYAFGTDDFTDTYYTGELVIPPSVESIGKGAFRGAHWITGLTLSPKLQVITEKSFDGCFDIENDIVIPKSVKRIEKYALGGYPNAMNKKMIILGNLEYFNHTSLPGFEILEIQGNVPYYILNGLGVGGNWLTIIGHTGSDAERFAKAKGLTFIPIEKE